MEWKLFYSKNYVQMIFCEVNTQFYLGIAIDFDDALEEFEK